MAVNKIVYGNQTLIDLTADTITAADLANGKTAHDKSGAIITGTSTKDADTSDATAVASEILSGKTAYATGNKVTGSMTNRGAVTGTIETKAQEFTIQSGYHDGSGKVSIDADEQAKIIAGNIKSGVSILGVEGTYSGEGGYYWANSVGVVDSLDSTSATSALSANMGKTLNETKQNKLVEGDHVSIDAQNVISVTDITSIEVESYTSTGTHIADITLDGVKTELYAPAGGGASVEVIDNLNSTSATSALSANQGRVLQSEVDDLSKYESTDYSGNGLTFKASKLGRIVQLNFHSGSTSGSVSAWTTIATLDSKYRPNKNMYYRDSYSNKLLYVGTNGLVQFAENVDSGVAFRSIQLFIK